MIVDNNTQGLLQHNHSHGRGLGSASLSPQDQEILMEPYAMTMKFMDFKDELIVYGVKRMRNQNRTITSEELFKELSRLSEQEKCPGELSPLKHQDVTDSHMYGSDGEGGASSEEESMEYADAMGSLPEAAATSPPDLQTDGEQLAAVNMPTDILPEPTVRKDIEVPDREQKLSALKQKLKALRYENRKLKERQLCKSCRNRQVSITFLPCGHYSFCYDCGQKYNACPICRKTILADVRTFLA